MTQPPGGWPPAQQPPGGWPAAQQPPQGPDPSLLWALLPALTVGLGAFIPVLHAAIKLRRRNLFVAAGWLFAALVVIMASFALDGAFSATPDPGATDHIGLFGAVGTTVAIAAAGVGSILAFRLRPQVFDRLSASPAQTAAVAAVLADRRRREEARQLAARDPAMARELHVGRPDLPRKYDDGGLVDVNHVPTAVLVHELELSAQQAEAVVAAREELGGFSHLAELTAYTSLPPALVDRIAERALLLP